MFAIRGEGRKSRAIGKDKKQVLTREEKTSSATCSSYFNFLEFQETGEKNRKNISGIEDCDTKIGGRKADEDEDEDRRRIDEATRAAWQKECENYQLTLVTDMRSNNVFGAFMKATN